MNLGMPSGLLSKIGPTHTRLVKSQRLISNALGVSFSRGRYSVPWPCVVCKTTLPRAFELTNGVHRCPLMRF